MPSPQTRKRKHLANRKFPRKQTPWNSHRPTPGGAAHRPDGTTHITSLHRTLKKKKKKKHKHGLKIQSFIYSELHYNVYGTNEKSGREHSSTITWAIRVRVNFNVSRYITDGGCFIKVIMNVLLSYFCTKMYSQVCGRDCPRVIERQSTYNILLKQYGNEDYKRTSLYLLV